MYIILCKNMQYQREYMLTFLPRVLCVLGNCYALLVNFSFQGLSPLARVLLTISRSTDGQAIQLWLIGEITFPCRLLEGQEQIKAMSKTILTLVQKKCTLVFYMVWTWKQLSATGSQWSVRLPAHRTTKEKPRRGAESQRSRVESWCHF